MNNGDVVSILSYFFYLIFEVEISELIDITFFKIVNGFGLPCQNEESDEKNEKKLLAHFLRVKILIITIKIDRLYFKIT